jgi:HAMP domain-containing protein
MGLRLKFNLCLLIILAIGMAAFGFEGYALLQRNAQDEVKQTASLMMESALAVRTYTNTNIKPHLDPHLDLEFLPQSVPAFAATETMNEVRKKYPEFLYKEAALNPTNPRDRASDWEADVINAFRTGSEQKLITGERGSGDARLFYIARPIKITNGACLGCHSTPKAAPASMIAVYGENNGFGWQLNETIGAQIVTVPMAVPVKKADHAFYTFMLFLTAVFVLIFIALHVMLGHFVIKPLERMAAAADAISRGDLNVSELAESGKDEVSRLATVFNRMMRSLKKALQLLDGQ